MVYRNIFFVIITNIWYTIINRGIPEGVKMYTAKVSAKGWIVIPKYLREKYGLKKGSSVQVVDYGEVLALVPLPDLLAERGRERAREEGGRE
jgi:AbrB family looped-hinge helix DNA binding protein